jgi:hypothetical protein
MSVTFKKNPALVQPEYRPLHKYLDQRYAHRVTLTFSEMESVLGAPLPELARRSDDWWLCEGEAPNPQSETWKQAERMAVPNLKAGTVTFERLLN